MINTIQSETYVDATVKPNPTKRDAPPDGTASASHTRNAAAENIELHRILSCVDIPRVMLL